MQEGKSPKNNQGVVNWPDKKNRCSLLPITESTEDFWSRVGGGAGMWRAVVFLFDGLGDETSVPCWMSEPGSKGWGCPSPCPSSLAGAKAPVLTSKLLSNKFSLSSRVQMSLVKTTKSSNIFWHAHTATFIYFGLCWVFFAACGLSLVAENGGCFLAVVHRLRIAVASLVAGHRL